jgi:hypothetical protein
MERELTNLVRVRTKGSKIDEFREGSVLHLGGQDAARD